MIIVASCAFLTNLIFCFYSICFRHMKPPGKCWLPIERCFYVTWLCSSVQGPVNASHICKVTVFFIIIFYINLPPGLFRSFVSFPIYFSCFRLATINGCTSNDCSIALFSGIRSRYRCRLKTQVGTEASAGAT